MPDQPRRRLGYANVMSTLAVFIALGGSSYAAARINGQSIANRSIGAPKLKRNTLTGLEVNEARLGRVPRAQRADNADTLSGQTAADLHLSCPDDTFWAADVCVEKAPRGVATYDSAILECEQVGRAGQPAAPVAPGRRLPTHGELRAALATVDLAAGGELTSEVYPSRTNPGQLDVLYITDEVGTASVTTSAFDNVKAYRCVTDPVY